MSSLTCIMTELNLMEEFLSLVSVIKWVEVSSCQKTATTILLAVYYG